MVRSRGAAAQKSDGHNKRPKTFGKEYQGWGVQENVLSLEELIRQIRLRRLALGLTQTELAKRAQTSQSLIAKLEQAKINPAYETVRLILGALNDASAVKDPTAGELMHKDLVSASSDETVAEVLARMKDHGFSQLPVLDGLHAVGALSERDLLHYLERGERVSEVKRRRVTQVMRGAFPTVDPTTSRRVIVELLREQDAVLVADGGKVVGLITKSDLW